MHQPSVPPHPADVADAAAVDAARARAGVDALSSAAADHERSLRHLLDAALDALAGDGPDPVVGLALVEHLVVDLGVSRALACRLETVALRLPTLPHVAAAYRAGRLGFDQLAHLVTVTARHHGAGLARLDEEAASLATALAEDGRSWTFDDRLDALVNATRAPGWAERAERRAADGMRVVVQQDFDGGGFVHADLDAPSLTTVVAGIDAAAATLAEDGLRTANRAHGLVALATDWLTGDSTSGRAARATITVVVDLATATTDRFGQLLRVAGGGRTPTVSARLTDALAAHAELLVQLVDGRRPLAELRATDDVPAAVRRAVTVRDGGCRFPACRATRVHVHHIVHRAEGGTDDPDNLLALCARHHLHAVHRLGWRPTLHPTTATVAWHRPGRRRPVTTTPHRPTSRPPPAPGDRPPDWLVPPIPPAPTDADDRPDAVPPGDPPHRHHAA